MGASDNGHTKRACARTISKHPLNTPHNTLLNHSPPSSASSGSSTNSASGFSSNVSVKEGCGADVAGCACACAWEDVGGSGDEEGRAEVCVTMGTMLRKVLKPTCGCMR